MNGWDGDTLDGYGWIFAVIIILILFSWYRVHRLENRFTSFRLRFSLSSRGTIVYPLFKKHSARLESRGDCVDAVVGKGGTFGTRACF
jgi:hypothetical protein